MNREHGRRPPRVAGALLRWTIPAGLVRDSILGDLAEEYRGLLESSGYRVARRWYWRQAVGVGCWALSDRLGGHPWSRRSPPESRRLILPKAEGFRPLQLLTQLGPELRFALRQLLRRPGLSFTAVLSLSLGIGATTAIFSLLHSLLLRPLPVEEPGRLVSIYTSQTGGQRHGNTSYRDYLDYRDRNGALSGLAAHMVAPMALASEDYPEIVWGQLVSGDYFELLGVEPALGRGFLPEEDQAFGSHPVTVLSYAVWRDRFSSDPQVLGRSVLINEVPFTVVGVAPAGFTGLTSLPKPALWAPLAMVEQALPYTPNVESRIDPWLQLVGRLRPGITLADARASLGALAADLAEEFPETNGNKGIAVETLSAGRLGTPEAKAEAQGILSVLLGVVGFVLLIACFNVANLELAKAAGRRREIALRHSLGGSRWRIMRQLLAESMVLAVSAAGLGLLLAFYFVQALQALQGHMEVPIPIEANPDARVLAFTALLAVFTGLFFGLAPALQVLKPGQADALKDEGYALSQSRGAGRLQSGLVVGQVALSLVLLTGAGLLARSLENTLAIDPGFDLRRGVVVPVNLGYGQYGEEEGEALQRRILEEVSSLPGVQSAALTAFVPLGMVHGHHDVYVEGYDPAPNEIMLVKRNMVSAGYFRTMGIRVTRGRAIDERDTEDAPPVAMVNAVMARRFGPDRDPIGQTVRADLGIEYTVVGVIEDGRYGSLRDPLEPYLAIPLGQGEYVQRVNLVARARGDAEPLARLLSSEVRALTPGLPSPVATTIPRYLEYSQGTARAAAFLVGLFGLLALVLASVGLYGVLSYNVNQRTREFGIRLAIGATNTGVTRMVLMRGLKTTLLGLVVGALLALGVTRILAGLLVDVSPLDPVVFSTAVVMLLAVGQLASYLPSRLASRSDPVRALKAE